MWILFFVFMAMLAGLMMIPNAILGGFILFVLCILGVSSGVWFLVIPSVLLLIGQMALIFGE